MKDTRFSDSELNKISRFFNQVMTEIYGLARENLEATTLVPKYNGIDEWADTITYKVISEVGMAKYISDYAEDLPPISRLMELKSAMIKEFGNSYEYSIFELNKWLRAGVNLSRDEGDTARRKIDETVDGIILMGSEEARLPGFLNNPNVSFATIAKGAKDKTTWKDKTINEIVADVQVMIDTVRLNSKKTIKADTLGINHDAFVYVSTTQRDASSEQTILEYLLKVFKGQGISSIVEIAALDGIGVGGTNRAVLYKKDPSCVAYILPIPFRQEQPQAQSLAYKVPCYCRIGGTVVKNVNSIVYADGI